MTLADLLPALGAFLAGAVVASLLWWVWNWYQDGSGGPAPAPPVPPAGPRSRPASTRADGVLRTSQRVLLHLSRQARLAYGDVAGPELTQAGISRALSVSQPALARVLRRLLDGDAILEMRTHVKGQSKRLKVYQLTVHGEAIARDIRGQVARRAFEGGPGPTAPPVGPDPALTLSPVEA